MQLFFFYSHFARADDETLQPVELKLDWSFPRAGGPQPMTMVFSSPRHFDYTMVCIQISYLSNKI